MNAWIAFVCYIILSHERTPSLTFPSIFLYFEFRSGLYRSRFDWIRLVTGLAQISRNVPTGRGDGTPKNKYRLEIKIRREREK